MLRVKSKFNKKTIITVILTIVITVAATLVGEVGLGLVSVIPRRDYEKYKKFNKLIAMEEMIKETYYKDVKEQDLIDGAMKGLFMGTGDLYSGYFTEEEMQSVMDSSTGSFVGIGVTILSNPENGVVTIAKAWETGPAYKSGIRAGDILYKVDDLYVTYDTVDKAVSIMKGKKDTYVNVSVKRDGEIKTFKIKRAEVSEPSVSGKMLENKIGYIELSTFVEKTPEDFNKELNKLKKQHMKALIIDLRDNGGGLVDKCCEVADTLIGEGTIVYTEDRDGNKETQKSDAKKLGLPIVLLTNGNTASSAEILTGAILGNKVGISVGTKTFGKGIVQSVISLKDGSGYKLTTEQYFTPDGKTIHKKGIKPTIEEKDTEKQLQRAIDYIENGK
ncbi:S41 family peptidase [Peptacetobacter sp.]|uniref:S41 family peptidase n=1 Tax=Peptacetobacter sp. TaxID=2991975 RepID=UPI002E77EB33|nr:S41 family peptidase [Peptacetobacter sp.]MEE0452134.1 S41 family peptidase [Peptacetobacter sp.]